MPNWCSNTLKISGTVEQLNLIKTRFQYISDQQERNALRMVIIHCWYIFIHHSDSMEEDSRIMDIYDRILHISNHEKMTFEICNEVRQTFFDLSLTLDVDQRHLSPILPLGSDRHMESNRVLFENPLTC